MVFSSEYSIHKKFHQRKMVSYQVCISISNIVGIIEDEYHMVLLNLYKLIWNELPITNWDEIDRRGYKVPHKILQLLLIQTGWISPGDLGLPWYVPSSVGVPRTISSSILDRFSNLLAHMKALAVFYNSSY